MWSEPPLVSVVIIFWNAGAFLQEAIESVLSQTYPAWQLLLVDDGSADDSTAIARGYAQGDPARITYLHHPNHENRGMSASRNLGLRQAQGQFVAFLDADDTWVPHTLAEQVEILMAHPEAALVYGPIQWWYGWTGKREDQQRDYVEDLGVPARTLLSPPRLLTLFIQNRATVPSGFLVRREAAERVGGFNEAFRGLYEDQVFCAKICLKFPVIASDHCWYRYRQHPGSSCQTAKRQGVYTSARPIFLRWLVMYLKAERARDPELWRALREELWRYDHPIQHWFSNRLVPILIGTARRSL